MDIDKLPVFPGFTVYDAETGDAIDVDEALQLINYKTKVNSGIHSGLMLTENGAIAVLINKEFGIFTYGSDHKKFIIQLGNGEMFRW